MQPAEVVKRRVAHAAGRPVHGTVTEYRFRSGAKVIVYKLTAPVQRGAIKLSHLLEYTMTGEPEVVIIEWGARRNA